MGGRVERRVRVVGALVATVLTAAMVTFGVRVATGALRPRYQVEARFAAAGQGLIAGSDVKVHGVNVGRVASVRLDGGRALVRMDIDADERIPVASTATIRPKTLFGEKFVDVDPGPAEVTGPFLADEGRITRTVGGFELERVLADLHPVLEAVDPVELAVVLDTLAEGGRGTGPALNRQIAAWRAVLDVSARHSADTRRFLADLADLSEELAHRAPDAVGLAEALNRSLPTVNAREVQVTELLTQLGRLSHDAADLLEANDSLLEKAVTEGGKVLQVASDRRGQVAPLVVGLRQYVQVLAEVGRVPFGDGTMLAAVKLVFGEEHPCGREPEGCAPAPGAAVAGPAADTTPEPAGLRPLATRGVEAVRQLLAGALA